MQQIERYGVIALVFLLVTIVAVSFWGDKKSPGFWARLTGRGESKKEAPIADAELAHLQLGATERAVENAMPLSTPPAQPTPITPNTDAIYASNVPAADAATQAAAPAVATPAPNAGELTVAPPSITDPAASYTARAPVTQPASGAATSRANADAPRSSDASSSARVYVVQKGDNFGAIARKTLGKSSRWPEIQAMNGGLDPKSLRVGMKLALPAGASTKSDDASVPSSKKSGTEKRAAPAASTSSTSKTYVVRAGDSLRKIAETRLGDGGRWKEIVNLNPGLDPNRLAVGRTLKLPIESPRALVAQASSNAPAANSEKPRVR